MNREPMHNLTKEPIPVLTSPSTRIGGRTEIRTHILETVRRRYECDLEELVRVCSSYTWNQVFLEVDRLSRTGELRLMAKRAGGYAVTLPVQPAV